MVRQRTLTPSFQGSNPCSPATKPQQIFLVRLFFVRETAIYVASRAFSVFGNRDFGGREGEGSGEEFSGIS